MAKSMLAKICAAVSSLALSFALVPAVAFAAGEQGELPAATNLHWNVGEGRNFPQMAVWDTPDSQAGDAVDHYAVQAQWTSLSDASDIKYLTV